MIATIADAYIPIRESALTDREVVVLVAILITLVCLAAGTWVLASFARRRHRARKLAEAKGDGASGGAHVEGQRRGSWPSLLGLLWWIAVHPALPLAVGVHIVVFALFFMIVVDQRILPKPAEIQIGIEIALEDSEGEPTPDPGGGGNQTVDEEAVNSSQSIHVRPDPDARQGGSTSTTPTPTDDRNDTDDGQPATTGQERPEPFGPVVPGDPGQNGPSISDGGSAGAFSRRLGQGGREMGISLNGGTGATESAVDAGLAWLSGHAHREHDDDGRPLVWWRPRQFDLDAQSVPGGGARCTCADGRKNQGNDSSAIGTTAIAALAMLAAGNTPVHGDYSRVVAGVVRWLIAKQERDGAIGENTMYNHAIATMVLAECQVLLVGVDTPAAEQWREEIRPVLQSAVDFIIRSQQEHGGWDYFVGSRARNDMSISTWCVMALTDAMAAGVEVSRTTMLRVIHLLKRMTPSDGMTWYADYSRLGDFRSGPGIVSSAAFCRMLLGCPEDDPVLALQLESMRRQPPRRDVSTRDSNYYTWYVGTLASFFAGGDQWALWNRTMRDVSLSLVDDGPSHGRGSWPGIGHWCDRGGRVYATALNVLNLTIYYRYVPAYIYAESQSSYGRFWSDEDALYRVLGEQLRGSKAKPD